VALLGGAVSMIIRVAGTMGVADGGGAPATHAQPSNPDGIAVIAGGGSWSPAWCGLPVGFGREFPAVG